MGLKVLSLFDGMSNGQLALKRLRVKDYTYYASEIKPHAIKVTMTHFPNTIQIGDVTKVHYNNGVLYTEKGNYNIGKIDLLIGGSPCFVTGTKVITKSEYKNIENVKIGDEVITHTGKFKKVLSIGGKMSETVIVNAQGLKPIETTKEHPFYVRKMNRVLNNETKSYYRKFEEPIWKEAEKLEKGDFVGININTLEENELNLTKEECYILGRYIADGHTRKDFRTSENRPNDRHWQLILSIGNHKLEKLKNKINSINFSSYAHGKSVTRVVFSNKRLVEIAEKYCGIGAINKIIPQIFINLPVEYLSEVLEGYLDGDGSVKNGVYKASSISESLIMTLSQVIAKVYRTNSSYEYTKRPKTCVIEGRTVNQNDTYSITFRKEMKKQSNAKVIDDIVWLPIHNVTETKNFRDVYNIEVEDDNSYTANNCIVHNCQNFSILNKERLGLEGEKSKLFYEYLRLKNEINPKFFLLENVKMKKESKSQLDEYLNTTGLLINSNLVSCQNRPRLYWTNIDNVTIPEDKNINFQDFKDTIFDYCDKFKVNKTPSRIRMWNDGNGRKDIKSCDNITNATKIGCLTRKQDRSPNSGLIQHGDFCRYLTRREMEIAQTVPVGYTDCVSYNQAQDLLGDGWTVDVIAHILSFMEVNNENN